MTRSASANILVRRLPELNASFIAAIVERQGNRFSVISSLRRGAMPRHFFNPNKGNGGQAKDYRLSGGRTTIGFGRFMCTPPVWFRVHDEQGDSKTGTILLGHHPTPYVRSPFPISTIQHGASL